MSNVPVLKAVEAAWSFQRRYWREAPGALGLAAAASTLTGSIDYWRPNLPTMGLVMAVYFAAMIVAFSALSRLAFADEHPDDPEFVPGPGGIQFGRPEWRLTRFALLMMFLVFLALSTFVFAVMVILATSGLGAALTPGATPESIMESLSPGTSAALGLAMLVFLCAAMFVWVRLFLAPTAIIAEKRLVVFQTWPLTRGQFWRILAASVLVSLPPAIVAGLTGVVGLAAIGAPIGGETAPTLGIPAALGVSVLPGLIEGFVLLPLTVGLGAYLYRGLRPPDYVRTFE